MSKNIDYIISELKKDSLKESPRNKKIVEDELSLVQSLKKIGFDWSPSLKFPNDPKGFYENSLSLIDGMIFKYVSDVYTGYVHIIRVYCTIEYEVTIPGQKFTIGDLSSSEVIKTIKKYMPIS